MSLAPSGPSAAPAPSAAPEREVPWLAEDGGAVVQCGHGAPFEASLGQRGGIDLDEAERAEIDRALDHLRDNAGIDAPEVLQETKGDVDWVAVAEGGGGEESELTILLPDLESETGTVSLERSTKVTFSRERGQLRASAWGGCDASPYLPLDLMWVEVRPDGQPDPSATTIPLQLTERECTGARDPSEHLEEPHVVETSTSVTIYWTSRRLPGSATCPGNPTVERTITLQEPLGGRELLDGSSYPPRIG